MKTKKITVIISLLLVVALCLTGCTSKESMLVGKWGIEDSSRIVFTIYDDHTVKGSNGDWAKWALLADGTLKITGDYGETLTFDTSSLSSGQLILTQNSQSVTLVKK